MNQSPSLLTTSSALHRLVVACFCLLALAGCAGIQERVEETLNESMKSVSICTNLEVSRKGLVDNWKMFANTWKDVDTNNGGQCKANPLIQQYLKAKNSFTNEDFDIKKRCTNGWDDFKKSNNEITMEINAAIKDIDESLRDIKAIFKDDNLSQFELACKTDSRICGVKLLELLSLSTDLHRKKIY